ncbi:lactate utilization protein [Candidatus Saccharibacteria bacterium]|nr:lactate utilization protein [Candidatus Saccharibacteria bacterium]
MSKTTNNQTVVGSTAITETKAVSTNFAHAATDSEIEKARKALELNGFKVTVVDALDDAKQAVIKTVPKGSEVFTATSVTLDKSGLTEVLNSDNYVSVRNKFMPLYGQPDKAVEMKRIGSGSDYAVGSVHALTQDGQALIASATGSQLPNYVYGASNVIWVVGSQKIVKDLAQGLERIETHTFQLEDARAQEAYGAHSSLNKILFYRQENPGRVSIILVKESVGF